MKSKFAIGVLAVGLLSMGAVVGCKKPKTSASFEAFDFDIYLSNGSKTLNKGSEAQVIVVPTGGNPEDVREYSYSSSAETIAPISATGTVSCLAEGEATIYVFEKTSGITKALDLTLTDADPANGGYNFASASGSEAITKRTEILGALEKNAMDNHLTGITLFENGGFTKYSERIELPTTNYITGYGFGLLGEGKINAPMEAEENTNYKMYLHTASSSDPKKINARDDDGSQVSSLESYITSTYWGNKMNSTKDGYVWYPVLAKDKVTFNGKEQDFTRPVPVFNNQEVKPNEDPNPLGLYNTWRVYVKTGTDGLKYRYSGSAWNGVSFENRPVAIEDYEFAYRNLLTGSHNLSRGAQIAGDQTYGIYGAQRYYNNTNNKDMTDEQALTIWNNMKANGQLGVKTGNDPVNGDYIQLTLLNPIDRFTAMYQLTSNLYSPLPEDFIKAIGEGSVKVGAKRYGSFNDGTDAPVGHQNKMEDYVISVGPYMLERWEKNIQTVFKKNADWYETNRYFIQGIKIVIVTAAQQSTTAIYDRFTNTKDLDSCGIPVQYIEVEAYKPRVYETKGDATFKLNVNSCTQEYWNTLNKTIWKNSTQYEVKPWMSNDNFLNGLFFSINRYEFAKKRGSQPSINYFSDAYLSDPEKGISYNSTEAHKKAVEGYQTYDTDGNSTYGYSKDRAVACFGAAVKELVRQGKINYGTKSNPFEMKIAIKWMYQTDVKEYGEDIAKYFTDAFNDPAVCGNRVKLVVEQDAVSVWDKVYSEHLQIGKFDLGFGAISGNTYNPLNFLEVLKSDNSSHFTLNWGTDTSKISTTKPLIYDNKMWSFDALWAVADHGGIVRDGSVAKTVEKSYLVSGVNEFYNGANFMVATKFIDADAAILDVTRVQIFVYGFGGVDVTYTKEIIDGKVVAVINLTPELAAQINSDIRHANKMDDKDKYPKLWNETPFTLANYGKLWTVEVSYTLAIKVGNVTGAATENYVTAAKNESAWVDD